MKRILGSTGLAAAAALTLTVTGCGLVTGGDEPVDPALMLTSSAEALEEETVRFEMTMGDFMTITGVADPAAEAAEMAMTFDAEGMTMDMEFVVIGTDIWMNMGELGALLGAETPWMLVDLTRVGSDALMGFDPESRDPMGASEMLQGLGEVEQVDERTFEGVLDLTVAGSNMIDDEMVDLLGDDATRLAFTATIDDQDRLSTMSIALPPIPELDVDTIDVRYFDYGTDVEITPPPADQVSDMPAEFYELFEM